METNSSNRFDRRLRRPGVAAFVSFTVTIGVLTGFTGCERPPLCPDVSFGTEIPVPATNLTIPPIFAPIDATTTSAPSGVTVSIASNQGTVAFGGRGPFPAFIYERVSFAAADSTLYAGLGIGDGAWFPFWLYCSSDGRLTAIDGEMTDLDLGLSYEVAGTCSTENVAPTAPVVIPAHTLHPVALTCGFMVSAAGANQLDLSGGIPGTMTFVGDSAVVLPFHTIDCRTGCGSPGWYELHAIMWDPIQSVVAFEIFYLDAAGVVASNGIELPSGNLLEGDQFPNAVWSISR